MLHLDAADVAARLDRVALVNELERAFREPCQSPLREHHAVGATGEDEAWLLTMPAWQSGQSIGVKLVTVFPGNARRGKPAVHALYALFDGSNGIPVATLDGTELTRRRTAAASVLAARYLARPDAGRLLMVGTGALAAHVIDTYVASRPIRAVRVWGRDPGRAQAVVGGFQSRPFEIGRAEDLESAVRWADIISCATLATAPLVLGAWLSPGQHLDLIGAYTPSMREVDDAALARSRIHVDTREGALAESGELVQGIASGAIAAADICADLAELTRGAAHGRRSDQDITLFKSVGCALEDLAAARLALRRA
jgi:ornithine cyclodeaminase